MRLARIRIENLQRIERAEIELDGAQVHTFIGPNEAGKSTVLESVRLALGLPAAGVQKKDFHRLIRTGADYALVELTTSDGEIYGWEPGTPPSPNRVAETLGVEPKSLAAALTPEALLLMKPADRLKLFGVAAGNDWTHEKLIKAQILNEAVRERIIAKGIAAGKSEATKQRRAADAAVKAAGISYPEDAEVEIKDGTKRLSELDPDDLARIHRQLVDLRDDLNRRIAKSEAVSPERRTELEARVAKCESAVPDEGQAERIREAVEETTTLTKECADDVAGLWNTVIVLHSKIAGCKRDVTGIQERLGALDGTCPTCGQEWDGGASALEAELRSLQSDLAEHRAENESTRDMLAEARQDHARAVSAEQEARKSVQAMREAEQALAAARAALEALPEQTEDPAPLRAKVEAIDGKLVRLDEIRQQAAHYHGQVEKAREAEAKARDLTRAADQLREVEAAVGALEKSAALDPLHEVRAKVAAIAPAVLPGHTVTITDAFQVVMDGRPWRRACRSERARIDLLLRVALCETAGVRLLLVDDLDGLDAKNMTLVMRAVAGIRDRFDSILIAAADATPKPVKALPEWRRRWAVIDGAVSALGTEG